MVVTAIIGAQWGDEGKGKITDYYTHDADLVVRFQGGNNAGHTIVTGGRTYKFHLLPSGITHPDKIVVLGNGMVIDPGVLLQEIRGLGAEEANTARMFISDRATMIMPYHRAQDALEEALRGSGKIGTTMKGIGPAYSDKSARQGLRMGDLLDMDTFRSRLANALRLKSALFRGYTGMLDESGVEYDQDMVDTSLDPDAIIGEFTAHGEALRTMIADTSAVLASARASGKNILLEGAQGTLLDIDHGTVPYVTSSNTVSGMAATGSGLGPMHIDRVIGIVKAYTTRVGEGPFPTEDHGPAGRHMAGVGREVGTTTGRSRRCGWLDMVLLRYAVEVNSISHIAITKLDVLSGLDEIKVCTAYRLDGREFRRPPYSAQDLSRVEPVYTTFPGWENCGPEDVSAAALPDGAMKYVNYMGRELGVVVDLVSLGPDRERTIQLNREGLN